METLWQDLRYAIRMLAKNPGFTAVAVLTLALGIGANTAIFSVANGVLLQPLPYQDPEQLAIVGIRVTTPNRQFPAMSPPDFLDLRREIEAFEMLAAGTNGDILGKQGNLTGEGDPERVDVAGVTQGFFSLFGIEPILGRPFLPEETAVNGPNVVILSHGLWQRRYGGDPRLVGKTIQLDGAGSTVVGILPREFRLLLPPDAYFLRDSDVWVPVQLNYDEWTRNFIPFTVFGHLNDDAGFEQAQAELEIISERFRRQHEVHQSMGTTFQVFPLHQYIVRGARPAILVLLGAVGFILLIACANVAHLLLARSTVREKEIAIRAALGAGQARIVRQILTESLLLALVGGALGLLVAQWSLELLLTLRPANLPRLENIRIDGMVQAFAVLASFATAILFGLKPALQVARIDPQRALREGGRTGTSEERHRFRAVLIATEIALSFVLLIGAGLLVRTLVSLQQVQPGFDPRDVVTFRLTLPDARYPELRDQASFYQQLEERIAALPGVRAVGAISQVPLTGSGGLQGYRTEEEVDETELDRDSADSRLVTPGYFRTMGTRLLAGRDFTQQDDPDHPFVVIVDETLVRQLWPQEDAIGQRLLLSVTRSLDPFVTEALWHEVVGVVEHVRNHDLTQVGRTQLYRPRAQHLSGQMVVAVRAAGDPLGLTRLLQREVHLLDRNLPVSNLRLMEAYVADAMAQVRFSLALIGVFGLLALVLVSVGLYGVVSYSISQRTHEIGVRMALGAQRGDILKLVVKQGLTLTLAGVAVGLAGAFALTRFLESLLFGVTATDPPTMAAVALLLTAVALLACYVPARRATRVDPMVALRYE